MLEEINTTGMQRMYVVSSSKENATVVQLVLIDMITLPTKTSKQCKKAKASSRTRSKIDSME